MTDYWDHPPHRSCNCAHCISYFHATVKSAAREVVHLHEGMYTLEDLEAVIESVKQAKRTQELIFRNALTYLKPHEPNPYE